MDATLGSVLIILILATVAGFVVFRNKARSSVEIDAKNKVLKVSGSNDYAPGAVIRKGTSQTGGALADDETGRGALIDEANVAGDLVARNRNPEKPDPKA